MLPWGVLLAVLALAASPAEGAFFGDLGFVQTQNVYYTGMASLSNFTYVPAPTVTPTPTRRAALAIGTGDADMSIYGLRKRAAAANKVHTTPCPSRRTTSGCKTHLPSVPSLRGSGGVSPAPFPRSQPPPVPNLLIHPPLLYRCVPAVSIVQWKLASQSQA